MQYYPYHNKNVTVEEVGPVESGYAEPVELEDLKDHLRLNSGTSEDAQLSVFISSARQHFEFSTDGRVCMPTVYRQYLSHWPTCNRYGTAQPIRLERGKVTSVDSVTYFDEDNQEQELEGVVSHLEGIPALVYLPTGNYPTVSATNLRPICIEFTAGWASAALVPSDVRLAILLLAGEFYESREAYTDTARVELPMGFLRVCGKYSTGLGKVI